MSCKLYIEMVLPTRTGAELSSTYNLGVGSHYGIEKLANLLNAIASGQAPAVIRHRMDDSVGVSATQTVVTVFASLAAGDQISIIDPTGRAITYTGQTTAVTAGDPTFRIQTNNGTTGASLVAQINADPRTQGWLTASGTTTVTITITQKGSAGNAWGLVKNAANAAGFTLGGANFTGGKDPGKLQVSTLALSGAMADADTVTVGGIVLTGKTSPSGESQFAVGTDAATDGAALAACINAHSKLKGIFSATGTSTVTVTLQVAGRIGALITMAKSSTAITLTGATFAQSTTDTWASSVVEYKIGAVAQ